MPVDSEHPQFTARKPEWKTIRDAIAGGRAIHAAGPDYLPKLYQQSPEDYADYNGRALWYNATGRTAEGFQGMLTRKPAVITATGIDEILDDCDLQGNSFQSHVQSIIWELLCPARFGTLIDYSTEATRSYVTSYATEDIINWRHKRINGVMALSFVMLHEISSEWSPLTGDDQPDKYEVPAYHQWRELSLEPFGLGHTAIVRVFRKKATGKASAAKEEFVMISETELSRRGFRLDFLPFVFHGLEAHRATPSKPILLDLADVNISDFRNSADRENGLHVAGLPTPWAAGFTDSNKDTLTLGTSRVWVTEETDAQCGYLEYSGSGLKSIAEAQKEKRDMMAALGARILDAPTNSAEATETVRLRQTSESNVLTDLAACAEQSASEVLRILRWWTGTETDLAALHDSTFVAINKDLVGSRLDPTALTALIGGFQSNALSFETFFHNLSQGNIYPDGHTIEKERTGIANNPPPPALPEPKPAE